MQCGHATKKLNVIAGEYWYLELTIVSMAQSLHTILLPWSQVNERSQDCVPKATGDGNFRGKLQRSLWNGSTIIDARRAKKNSEILSDKYFELYAALETHLERKYSPYPNANGILPLHINSRRRILENSTSLLSAGAAVGPTDNIGFQSVDLVSTCVEISTNAGANVEALTLPHYSSHALRANWPSCALSLTALVL